MSDDGIQCHLRRAVGERASILLECEQGHVRSEEIPSSQTGVGLAALQDMRPLSACPLCQDAERVMATETLIRYDTEDGRLHPGDMYWVSFLHERGRCSSVTPGWTNCDGRHLFVVLPNGHHWDVDARAANCTKPDDGEHRCWVRHGSPPAVTVDKDGDTCAAGRGSVRSGDYHGCLRGGRLIPVSGSRRPEDEGR